MSRDYNNPQPTGYAQHEQARTVGPSTAPAGALATRIVALQQAVGTLVAYRQRLEVLCDRLGVSYQEPPSAPQPPTGPSQELTTRERSLMERVDYQLDRLGDELGRIKRCNDALDGAL